MKDCVFNDWLQRELWTITLAGIGTDLIFYMEDISISHMLNLYILFE